MEIQDFKMRVTPTQNRVVQKTLKSYGCMPNVERYINWPYLYFLQWEDNKILLGGKFPEVFRDIIDIQELTFEQFKAKYIDEYVLPRKWCIKVDAGPNFDLFNEWRKTTVYGEYSGTAGYLTCTGKWYKHIPTGYTEITFDQFKKHVLKQDDMDKKIVGYKWKPGYEEKYREAAKAISEWNGWDERKNGKLNEDGVLFASGELTGDVSSELSEAGVLDLWFDPIYEEEKKLPVINGYEGQLIDDHMVSTIKYGCAYFNADDIVKLDRAIDNFQTSCNTSDLNANRRINRVVLDSDVTLWADEIRRMAEYIKENR